MAVAIPFIMAGAAVVGAVATVKGARESKKAGQAQQRAMNRQAESQRRIADIRASRERVKAARKKRRAIATAQAAETASGVTTTATQGFIGSVKSQSASAAQAVGATDQLTEETSIFNQRQSNVAQGHMNSAANAQMFGDIAGGVSKVASIFGS